ncbi:MAG TPA: Wzz/FepE/Etk N-terminal domain-containing protein [Anaerolineae bacterium]|nr:Wzz/FepE/Etk N-terminal domain-containing protein [Anaerolineae bacterium]
MELADYIRILRKRWWIIAVAVVLTAGSAFIFSRLQTPVYESSAQILVKVRPDLGLTQSAKWLLRSYVARMYTRDWAERVIELGQLPMTPEKLMGNVTVASDESRFVIQIDVEDYDGDVANDIARTWSDLFIQWRNSENTTQRKEDRVEAELLDQPTYVQSWPKTKIVTAAGGIFGLVIAGVVIFFLEWLEAGVIRTPQDLERQLNLTVMGAIPSSD